MHHNFGPGCHICAALPSSSSVSSAAPAPLWFPLPGDYLMCFTCVLPSCVYIPLPHLLPSCSVSCAKSLYCAFVPQCFWLLLFSLKMTKLISVCVLVALLHRASVINCAVTQAVWWGLHVCQKHTKDLIFKICGSWGVFVFRVVRWRGLRQILEVIGLAFVHEENNSL